MKIVALRIFLSSLTTLSSAGLAQSQPTSPEIVLELKSFGGYLPAEDQGWERGVRIFADGRVTGFDRQNAFSQETVLSIAQLSPEVSTRLAGRIASLPAGPLEFPDTLGCVDIPTTSYTSPSQRLLFAQNANCKMGYLKGSLIARDLVGLLNSFRVLYGFADTETSAVD